MKNLCALITLFFFTMTINCFADNAITLPTAGSKPVPSLATTKNTDVVITEKVQNALQKSADLKGQAVSAVSQKGVITLQGSVDSKALEQEAINIAKKVSGVTQVISQLTIKTHSSTK